MRSTTLLSLVVAIAVGASAAAVPAQTPSQSLEIYAVNVVKNAPFEKQYVGFGIYLGGGYVLTAAHVVGHWALITIPVFGSPVRICRRSSSSRDLLNIPIWPYCQSTKPSYR